MAHHYVTGHEIRELVDEINHYLAGAYTKRPVRSQFAVRISDDLDAYLREQLGLTGRFQLMPHMLTSLGLLARIDHFDGVRFAAAFRARIWERRVHRVRVNDVPITIQGPRFLTIKVTRDNAARQENNNNVQ